MRMPALALLALLTLIFASADAGAGSRRSDRSGVSEVAEATDSLSPTSGLELRPVFDSNPKRFLSAYVRPGSGPSEKRAQRGACSVKFDIDTLEGSDTTYEETMRVDSFLSRLGVSDWVGASGKGDREALVRVSYTHTATMVASVADPVSYAESCAENPGTCGPYIDSYLQGTG